MSTNKVYGDGPNFVPLRRARHPLRLRRSGLRRGHRRDLQHRPLQAQPVRREQGRGRRAGAGVRPLLRDEHRLLPRRLPDRRRPLGRPAARLLSYIFKAAAQGRRYTVFGYKGKQVRDHIHSRDVIGAIAAFIDAAAAGCGLQPRRRQGATASRSSSRSTASTRSPASASTGRCARRTASATISSTIPTSRRFRPDYPEWDLTMSIDDIFEEFARVSFAGAVGGMNGSPRDPASPCRRPGPAAPAGAGARRWRAAPPAAAAPHPHRAQLPRLLLHRPRPAQRPLRRAGDDAARPLSPLAAVGRRGHLRARAGLRRAPHLERGAAPDPATVRHHLRGLHAAHAGRPADRLARAAPCGGGCSATGASA